MIAHPNIRSLIGAKVKKTLPKDSCSINPILFCLALSLSFCEALKLRSLPFTRPVYVASRYFQ